MVNLKIELHILRTGLPVPNTQDTLTPLPQVHLAISGQPDGSSLPRILADEGWNGEQFSNLNHLRLAKAVSDIIQNLQRNKKLK